VDGNFNAEIHPVDVSKLFKGQTIEAEEIERFYNVKRDADVPSYKRYALCLLQLKAFIENRTTFRCKCEHGKLRILTDEELSEYAWSKSVKAVRRIQRYAADATLVDTTDFDDDRRRLAESRMQAQALIATAASKAESDARRELKLSLPAVLPELPEDVD